MKNFFLGLLGFIAVVIGLSIVIGWFWGIPLLGTLVSDLPYTFFATIWLSIHLVSNVVRRVILQKKLEKYQTLHRILGGK